MIIHLFGANTSLGNSFIDLIDNNNLKVKIIKYSRSKNSKDSVYLDLEKPQKFRPIPENDHSIIISFVPIWIFSKFMIHSTKYHPIFVKSLTKIIVCSSSSSLTKKYAFNSFDKNLSKVLTNSENELIEIGEKFKFETLIVQPSMIYGSYKSFKDKNINILKILMRYLPIVFLPKNSGKRQPIHCNDLANVFLNILKNHNTRIHFNKSRLTVGGDEEFSYKEMLIRIQKNSRKNDLIRICKIFEIPDFLFIIFAMPIAIFSLKYFEAILRIFSNLNKFTKQELITGIKSKKFPYEINK